jgi:Flp pilus assembly protein TadG
MTTCRLQRGRHRGQALVEFSLALIPFLLVLLGIADLGRGIYTSNGVSEAAREIARTTAVHLCASGLTCTLGSSAETTDTINVQKRLVPGLAGPSSSIVFSCTDNIETVQARCDPGDFVEVTVTVPYSTLTPLLSMVAPTSLSATAHVVVP